jgi:hypothetical protein
MTEEDEAFNEIERRSIAKKEAVKAQLKSQEPVAWMVWGENNVPALTFTKPADKYVFDSLYTHPPQRTWVGLTTEEILDLFDLNNVYGSKWIEFARTVEAKLKEKNT